MINMLTREELEAIWAAPYGAFDQWKKANKKALAMIKKEKNFLNYEIKITVYKKEPIMEFNYKFKALDYHNATTRSHEFVDKAKQTLNINKHSPDYIISSNIKQV